MMMSLTTTFILKSIVSYFYMHFHALLMFKKCVDSREPFDTHILYIL